MKRRQACIGALSVLVAGTVGGQTQQVRKSALVAVLGMGSPETTGRYVEVLKGHLSDLGWRENQNVTYAIRYAEGHAERLPILARELIVLKPDVIWTSTSAIAEAAQHETVTIPIVFAASGDPVAAGLARSLASPGGNATGLSNMGPDMVPKLLELLRLARPGLSRIGLVWNSTSVGGRVWERAARAAAHEMKLTLVAANLVDPGGLHEVLALLQREQVEAVLFFTDPVQLMVEQPLEDFLIKNRLPSIFYGSDNFLHRGGLISYGRDWNEQWRLSAGYVDRILRGAKPADLPIEQPTRIEFTINLRAAKALGIAVPQSLRMRADKVIE